MSEKKRCDVTYTDLSSIRPYERNPRNNEPAVNAVAASIQAFGFLVPIVIDKDGVIVAGHTRYQAAKLLNLERVPTILADDLTEDEVKAFRLADNKTAELAVWDMDLLDQELAELDGLIDMEDFGFFSESEEDEDADYDGAKELDLDEYADRKFEYECPECGFHFSV